jgi:hypothetical protein
MPMNWKSPRAVETRIRRLTREIAKIDDVFYGANTGTQYSEVSNSPSAVSTQLI